MAQLIGHPAERGVELYGQAQAVIALVHFFPLSIMWTAAAIFDRPLVDDSYGPVILSLWVEQWVAPPAVGAFLVILGVFDRSRGPLTRAAMRLVGSVTVCFTVMAFGIAGFWASDMKPIFVYSVTTPFFVFGMMWLSAGDFARGLWGDGTREHV